MARKAARQSRDTQSGQAMVGVRGPGRAGGSAVIGKAEGSQDALGGGTVVCLALVHNGA